jgi:uncharacterized membrane protein YdjX (TVP38/TMEM64 family)
MNNRSGKLAAILVLVASAALCMMLQRTEFPLFADSQRLRDWVLGWDAYAPVAIILLQGAQVLLAPIPGQGVGAASGYLFGSCWGTIYSLTGTVIGSFVAISLARHYGRPLVERVISADVLARFDARAGHRGLLFFALVFLLPFLPDDVACFVAGLSAIPIPALMLTVLAGRMPGVFVSAWIGANATSLGTGQLVWLIVAGGAVAAAFLAFEARLQAGAMDLLDRLSR